MRHANGKGRRAGVTLIEILVVLAIMALLLSLSMAAYQKVRISQMARTTDDVVVKLQTGVDNLVKIIADGVGVERRNRSADFETMRNVVGGDDDRAVALLLYCRLKQNFPTTAGEVNQANFTVSLNGYTVNFPRPAHFQPLAGTNDTDENVSAAVLYLALARSAQGGNNFDSDAATSGAQTDMPLTVANGNPVPVRVYADGWGTLISFKRFWQDDELNKPPFVKAAGSANDPFDPAGKLASWSLPPARRDALEDLLRPPPPPPPPPQQPPPRPWLFNNQNKSMLVYARGINQKPELSPTGSGDDVLGYRLRSLGRKGDK